MLTAHHIKQGVEYAHPLGLHSHDVDLDKPTTYLSFAEAPAPQFEQ